MYLGLPDLIGRHENGTTQVVAVEQGPALAAGHQVLLGGSVTEMTGDVSGWSKKKPKERLV